MNTKPVFEEIAAGLYQLKVPLDTLWTGVFLVIGNHKYMIDSACNAKDVETVIIPALADMGLSITDLDYLLCTHTHGDHIGGHKQIKRLHPRITIVAWKGAMDKIRDPLKYNKQIRAVFPEHSAPPSLGLQGVTPDVLLEDGEILHDKLQLIHTPGHDSDALCWLDMDTGVLISGDSLQAYGTSTVGLALVMKLEDYLQTLEKLNKWEGISFIAAGHPFLFPDRTEHSFCRARQFLDTCQEAIAEYTRYLRNYTAGNKYIAPVDISRQLIASFGGNAPGYMFLPLFTVTEIINHLKGKM